MSEIVSQQIAFKASPANIEGAKVRVPALLFRAGAYPDKGVTITTAELAALVLAFNAANKPAPIKVEHFDSPLDPLGEAVVLYLEGDELFGVLTFSAGIYSHLQQQGAEKLSIKLLKDENGLTLSEVSIVATPRVAGAGFLQPDQVAAKIASFQASGKVTPAMVPHVRALLSAPLAVTFSDGSTISVAAEIEAMINALPVVQPRGSGVVPVVVPAAPGSGGVQAVAFSGNPDVVKWCASLGLDPAKIVKDMGAN